LSILAVFRVEFLCTIVLILAVGVLLIFKTTILLATQAVLSGTVFLALFFALLLLFGAGAVFLDGSADVVDAADLFVVVVDFAHDDVADFGGVGCEALALDLGARTGLESGGVLALLVTLDVCVQLLVGLQLVLEVAFALQVLVLLDLGVLVAAFGHARHSEVHFLELLAVDGAPETLRAAVVLLLGFLLVLDDGLVAEIHVLLGILDCTCNVLSGVVVEVVVPLFAGFLQSVSV